MMASPGSLDWCSYLLKASIFSSQEWPEDINIVISVQIFSRKKGLDVLASSVMASGGSAYFKRVPLDKITSVYGR